MVIAQQNKIRFDDQEDDLFRKQMKSIIKTLAATIKTNVNLILRES